MENHRDGEEYKSLFSLIFFNLPHYKTNNKQTKDLKWLIKMQFIQQVKKHEKQLKKSGRDGRKRGR